MAGSPYLVLALLLVAGAALYGLGTLLVRSASSETPQAAPQPQPSAQTLAWASSVAGTNDALDVATRIDLIERLALVGEPWCIDALRAAQVEESDGRVLAKLSDVLQGR